MAVWKLACNYLKQWGLKEGFFKQRKDAGWLKVIWNAARWKGLIYDREKSLKNLGVIISFGREEVHMCEIISRSFAMEICLNLENKSGWKTWSGWLIVDYCDLIQLILPKKSKDVLQSLEDMAWTVGWGGLLAVWNGRSQLILLSLHFHHVLTVRFKIGCGGAQSQNYIKCVIVQIFTDLTITLLYNHFISALLCLWLIWMGLLTSKHSIEQPSWLFLRLLLPGSL